MYDFQYYDLVSFLALRGNLFIIFEYLNISNISKQYYYLQNDFFIE